MKKFVFVTLFVFIIGLSVNANDSKKLQITGQLININDSNKTFAIADNKGQMHHFAITPTTNFKAKENMFSETNFSDFSTGDILSISYNSGRQLHIANEIKIH